MTVASALNNLPASPRAERPGACALHEENGDPARDRRPEWHSHVVEQPGCARDRSLRLSRRAGVHEESVAIAHEFRDRLATTGEPEGIAATAPALEGPASAARIWGAAARLREEIGAPLPATEQARYDRQVAAARSALGDDAAFEAAWRSGRTMSLEQAVQHALSPPSN